MRIDTDSLVLFLIAWGIPAFMIGHAFWKMNAEDRKSAIDDFKTPFFIFTFGLLLLGAFLNQAGTAIGVEELEAIGEGIFVVGGIIGVLTLWKKSKTKSVLVAGLLSISLFLL